MFANLQAFLQEWNTTTTDRQKLQHTYIVLMIVLTFAAGIITLANARRGHDLMMIVLGAGGALLANGLVWHVLNSAILMKLPGKPKKR